jgi:hypothetical protein
MGKTAPLMLQRTNCWTKGAATGQTAHMDTNKLLLEAIALRKCIVATYNRMRVKLAPHVLYTRHDELFVDAVTVERDGQLPREVKLGTFKLTGLKDLEFAGRTFQPESLFNPNDSKYEGSMLFAVEMA